MNDELLYPEAPANITGISITKQMLKGAQMKCELCAVTNVQNLAALTPEAWTNACFDFLFEMHQDDYDHFKNSCTDAVRRIRSKIESSSDKPKLEAVK